MWVIGIFGMVLFGVGGVSIMAYMVAQAYAESFILGMGSLMLAGAVIVLIAALIDSGAN